MLLVTAHLVYASHDHWQRLMLPGQFRHWVVKAFVTIFKLQSKCKQTSVQQRCMYQTGTFRHLQAVALIETCHRHLHCLLCVNPQVQTLADHDQEAECPN